MGISLKRTLIITIWHSWCRFRCGRSRVCRVCVCDFMRFYLRFAKNDGRLKAPCARTIVLHEAAEVIGFSLSHRFVHVNLYPEISHIIMACSLIICLLHIPSLTLLRCCRGSFVHRFMWSFPFFSLSLVVIFYHVISFLRKTIRMKSLKTALHSGKEHHVYK